MDKYKRRQLDFEVLKVVCNVVRFYVIKSLDEIDINDQQF